ncbi:hypothetical protein BDZ91DRAFT_747274 [Kalaharituber pfeilii]|nr:hypothetical protein BDZ91DRAFT_747274 [Kalaharituber pfeilii]
MVAGDRTRAGGGLLCGRHQGLIGEWVRGRGEGDWEGRFVCTQHRGPSELRELGQ